MSIQVNGTVVISNNREIQNVISYSGPGVASKEEAETATNNNKLMTPLRVKESILVNGLTTVIKSIQRGQTQITNTSKANGNLNSSPNYSNAGRNTFTTVNLGNIDNVDFGSSLGSAAGITPSANAFLSSATNLSITAGNLGIVIRNQFFNRTSSLINGGIMAWEVIEFE